MNRFEALSEQIKAMQNAGLEDSPACQRLLTLALESAPDSLKSAIMDKAVKEGRLPKPDGYDDAGEPVWMLETIAKSFGLSDEEIKLSLEEFQQERGPIPPIDTIHRLH